MSDKLFDGQWKAEDFSPANRIMLPVFDPSGEFQYLDIPLRFYLLLCRAIIRVTALDTEAAQLEEIRRITTLTVYGALMFAGIRQLEFTDHDHEVIAGTLGILHDRADKEKWKTDSDAVLSLCYHLIRIKQASHSDAFRMAERLLGSQTSKKAFRKRLNRWATAPQRRLEQVATQGRPRKKETESPYE